MKNSGMNHYWYVYILRCGDGSLYTGIATDVVRRLAEHQTNKGAKYLRGRGPLKLVFEKQVGSRSQALKIEHKVKGLTRKEKEDLINDRGNETYKSLVLPGD
jgi:putative endonuclease